MKNIYKNHKGITLIALIITIIVLLILAGVTIAAITSNESAPNKAVEARKKNELGAELDAIKLAAVSSIANGDYQLYVHVPTLKKGLEGAVKADSINSINENNYPWTVEGNSGTLYEITRTGDVTVKSGVALSASKINFKTTGGNTTATLTATLSQDLVGKTVAWSIPENNGVATISATQGESITVTKTGTTVGSTTITAHVDGIIPDKTVTVNILEVVDHVSLSPATLTVSEGKTGTLTLNAYGISNSATEADEVSYSSSNESVATVDNDGVVTGVAEGTATITVTADGKTATATVTVEEAVEPPVELQDEGNMKVVSVGSFAALKGYSKLPSTQNLKAYKNKGKDNEQQIIIPAGFTVVEGKKLEDGMVIRDVTYTNTNGSEFVWVPVGQTLTFVGTQGTGRITLSRYSFDSSTGAATAQDPTTIINSYFTENATSFTATDNKTHQATVARTVTNNNVTEIEFVKQANANKGYYIGRFEAGVLGTTASNTDKTYSINGTNDFTKNSAPTGKIVTKAGVGVWNYINRNNAKTVSQAMYSNDTKFKSELMTSYAWDTAVVFIQKCGNNATYSKQNSFNTGSPTTTGSAIKNSVNDVQCNIYDMASNVREWTTEYSSSFGCPCVSRGGIYGSSDSCVSYRGDYGTSDTTSNFGFRPLLYIM